MIDDTVHYIYYKYFQKVIKKNYDYFSCIIKFFPMDNG